MVPRSAGVALLVAVSAVAIAGVTLHGPIRDLPGYGAFADRETILGIPNFWNVVSNAPFLLVGCWGCLALRRGPRPGLLRPLAAAWTGLFAGTVLVGIGSTWYHLAPSDGTLAWDRLPMTVVFMSLLAIVLGESVGEAVGARLFVPLLLVGAGSVGYWGLTGDLRAYVLVQYLPALLIPLALLLFEQPLRPVAIVWTGLALYPLAKALELLDGPIREATGVIGGHPLKHVAAAAAIGCFVGALRRRRAASGGPRGA